MMEAIDDYTINELSVEDVLLLKVNNKEILNPPLLERDSYDKVLIFGDIPITRKSLDSEFDFIDFVDKNEEKNYYRCSYCGGLNLEDSKYVINVDNYNQEICEDCTRDIRRKCAIIGNNKSIISELVSSKI